ncbi:MAG: HAD family hydrolase [Candidatus Cyclobacteriaceae bacterium M3_2C_046]
MIKKIDAILFDMDGVLVLSEPVHYQAWKNVVKSIGLPEDILSEEDIIGHTDSKISFNLIDRAQISQDPSALIKKKITAFLNLLNDGIPEVKGRSQFLNYCKERYKLAVVSSSSRSEIHSILNASNIAGYFDFYLGYEDSELHKPYPEPYLKAINQLKIKPQNVLVIEDSPAGVNAGKAANARVIGLNTSGLLNGIHQIELFRDYEEILSWFNRTQ